MTATLRGMTWSHPRGYDPMVAVSAAFARTTGVAITWDKRSLQDFESYPVADLAAAYDLIVIDHPHVGQITAEGCLMPLDGAGESADDAAIAAGTVGASYRCYTYDGRQWAFPIDAATQVQAYRPDRLGKPVRSFDAVMDLARAGRVLLALRPPHGLMTFFTLAAHLGSPCAATPGVLIETDAGMAVMERLSALAGAVPAVCFGMDPIAVFEAMAEPASPAWTTPYAYGYVPYAVEGFRPRRLAFADMAVIDGRPPTGSALGGTGIAVSARTAHPQAALAFARFVASGAVQRDLYAGGGGQPGHADAWEDDAVNAATHEFYRGTRATLEGAWVRPRHKGYMSFQHEASEMINAALTGGGPADRLIDALNARYAASLA